MKLKLKLIRNHQSYKNQLFPALPVIRISQANSIWIHIWNLFIQLSNLLKSAGKYSKQKEARRTMNMREWAKPLIWWVKFCDWVYGAKVCRFWMASNSYLNITCLLCIIGGLRKILPEGSIGLNEGLHKTAVKFHWK